MANLGEKKEVGVYIDEKETIVFPDVKLCSNMLSAIKDCAIDEKYVLTFVAKVCELRKPNEYEKRNKVTDKDVFATFKLIDGNIRAYSKDKNGKEI